MRTVVVLAISLLLACPAHAWEVEPKESVELLIETSPSGAIVQTLGMRRETVGQTGKPLLLSVPRTRDSTLRLRLELEGWKPHDLTLQTAELKPGTVNRLPAEGVIALQPLTSWAPLRLFVQRHWWQLALAGLLVLGLLIGWVLPLQRRLAGRMRRMRELHVPRDGKDPYLGTVLDGRLLTRRIGKGGCATVYEAVPWDTLDETDAVAIKIVDPMAIDDEFRRRFAREVNICRTMDHPSVVRLMDWHDDEVLSIVMELVRGETLRRKMRPGGMPLEEVLPILKGIAQGVAHAHERGTVHNDLKPDNVMVTPDGRVRVMDFGIATAQAHTRLTATGETMGTPGYMAPEQYDGIRTDPRSDQYAFGVLTWEMLTGSRLFDEPDAMRRMARHMTETPLRVSDLVPAVPDVVSDVIARMLAKEAEDRYPTMQEAFRALEVAFLWRQSSQQSS